MEVILFLLIGLMGLIVGGGFLLALGIGLVAMAGMVIFAVIALLWRFIAIALLIFLGLFVTFLISEFPELIVLILFGVFVLGLCVFYFGENKDVENENRQAEIEGIKHLSKNPHYR